MSSNMTIEENFSQVDEADNLTEDERIKVYEEMEEIFLRSQESSKTTLEYSISSAPIGIKSPLIFNIGLIVFVAVTIFTTIILLDMRQSRNFSKTDDVTASQNTFTQEIIAKNKASLENKTNELDSLQAELEALLSGKQDLTTFYNKRINDYGDTLDIEKQNKLAALRKQLELQNISEEEIQKRVQALETKINEQYNAELEAYKKEQLEERTIKEKSLNQKINGLESEFESKTNEIESLQNDIQQREQELAEREQAIGSQLENTQSALSSLREEKEKKEKDIRKFTLHQTRIVTLIKENKLRIAKNAISESKKEVFASQFIESPEIKIYIDTYEAYEFMINTALLAENIIKNSASNRAKLLRAQAKQLKIIETLETSVETLKTLNNKQKSELSSVVSSLDVLTNDYEDLRKEFRRLNQEYIKTQESIDVLIDEAVAKVRAAQLNSVLENIKLISNYLTLKSQGIDDIEISELIKVLQIKNTIYKSIVDILTIAIQGEQVEVDQTPVLANEEDFLLEDEEDF